MFLSLPGGEPFYNTLIDPMLFNLINPMIRGFIFFIFKSFLLFLRENCLNMDIMDIYYVLPIK